jgi:hypothetical protein
LSCTQEVQSPEVESEFRPSFEVGDGDSHFRQHIVCLLTVYSTSSTGIVERHRTHRASASELSFRLSSDDAESPYHPLQTSHSHHHTSSISSIIPTRSIPSRPVSASFSRPRAGGNFKFPSPVLEQEDSFTLGDADTDNESLLGRESR